MKKILDLFDWAVNTLQTLFIGVCWLAFFCVVWFVVIGLLQAHDIISGWSIMSILFDGMPWYMEILTVLLIPVISGLLLGLVLYCIYEVFLGKKS